MVEDGSKGRFAMEDAAKFEYAQTEKQLMERLCSKVQELYDPDILAGHEIHKGSWGYLVDRARQVYDWDIKKSLGRVFEDDVSIDEEGEGWNDTYALNHSSAIKVSGRIVLNVWRIMRHELALNNYSFENLSFHILHKRVPVYTYENLSRWYGREDNMHLRWKVLRYYIDRVQKTLEMLDDSEFITKTR